MDGSGKDLGAIMPPMMLSYATFEVALMQLQVDMAAHHDTREMRELAQHANHEAHKGHWMPNKPSKADSAPPSLKRCCTCLTCKVEVTPRTPA